MVSVNGAGSDDEVLSTLGGYFDIAQAKQLRTQGQQALDLAQMQAMRLVLNLARVAFMDSTALNSLVAQRNEADQVRIRFALRNLQPQILHLLELTNMTDFLGPDDATNPRPPNTGPTENADSGSL